MVESMNSHVPSKVARYFWTPCQKWASGKKPFKLAVQLLKIVVITAQIYKFGSLTQGETLLVLKNYSQIFRYC